MRGKDTTRPSPNLAALVPALVILLLAGPSPGHAQQPPTPVESPPLRVEVRLVNVDVAVTDSEGKFIPDLGARRFRLQEDGKSQEIAHFSPTETPVRILLLVEASPAVFLIRGEHLAAAHALLQHLRPQDEAALASYSRTVQPQADFTRDKELIRHQLSRVTQFGLGIAEINLLDAVAETINQMSPPPQRTAVLIVGTGLDSGSRVPWEELQQRVGASQITFFAIATGRLMLGKPTKESAGVRGEFAEADSRLQALTESSAGQAYFPESLKELNGIYIEIAERLRNVYSLGYYPTNTEHDGGYRRISVELVDETGAPLELRDSRGRPFRPRVFARPGYFATRD